MNTHHLRSIAVAWLLFQGHPVVWAWAVLASSKSRRQAVTRPSETASEVAEVISLQDPHRRDPPAVVFRRLADVCEEEGIDTWDVYGDFPAAALARPQQEKEAADREANDEETGNVDNVDGIDNKKGDINNNGSDQDTENYDIDSDSEDTSNNNSEPEASPSFLRRFELEIAKEVGKEDAVFMPSGVMAQSIALLIHQNAKKRTGDGSGQYFVCHETSHLLLHEQEAYSALLHMKPIAVSTRGDANEEGLETPAMGFSHVLETLTDLQWSESVLTNNVAALLVELPHRELGGKITPWEDLVRLSDWCQNRKIPLHCDGARLFESTVAYEGRSPAELAALFDSVYLSFYKGLGGISGAMLCGSAAFCAEARTWLRRFGGNLYTLLPYAVSAYDGYQRNWKDTLSVESEVENSDQEEIENNLEVGLSPPPSYPMGFGEQRNKLRQIVAKLSSEELSLIPRLVTFDPAVPVTNMVHGYLRCSAEEGMEWCRWITAATGVQVLRRIRPLKDSDSPMWKAGYRSMFEWSMGNANGQIPEDVFFEGWKALAETYVANNAALENGESPIEYSEVDEELEEEESPAGTTIETSNE